MIQNILTTVICIKCPSEMNIIVFGCIKMSVGRHIFLWQNLLQKGFMFFMSKRTENGAHRIMIAILQVI
jgi:hypothetical protein